MEEVAEFPETELKTRGITQSVDGFCCDQLIVERTSFLTKVKRANEIVVERNS